MGRKRTYFLTLSCTVRRELDREVGPTAPFVQLNHTGSISRFPEPVFWSDKDILDKLRQGHSIRIENVEVLRSKHRKTLEKS